MANGEVNCILGVCCPEGSEAQVDALVTVMTTGISGVYSEAVVRQCATFMLAHFDLAEKGTLTAFKASVAKLARQPNHVPKQD